MLAEQILRRFMVATQKKTGVCWYRTRLQKGRVDLTVGWKPASDTPRVTDQRSRFDFYVYPEGWFSDVKKACQLLRQEAQKNLPEGLKISARFDNDFEKWARKPAASIDFINFFWLSVEVPKGAGQKKTATKLAADVKSYARHFEGLMNIETEAEVG